MLTAQLGRPPYRVPELVVSVPPLIPALEPCLQFEQAKPGDRSRDEETCHRE